VTARTRPAGLLVLALAIAALAWLVPAPAAAQFAPGPRNGVSLVTSYAVPATTTLCTGANQTETDLWTYTLPASPASFGADGRGIRITAWGLNAANSNVKTWKIHFGAATYTFTSGATNGTTSVGQLTVTRANAAAAQVYLGLGWVGAAVATPASGLLTVDTTAAVILKVSAQNGTANANDACLRGVFVERLL
jgi:hypothetical protein